MQEEYAAQPTDDCDCKQRRGVADKNGVVRTQREASTAQNPSTVHRIQWQQIKTALYQSAYSPKRESMNKQQTQETAERTGQCTEKFFF